MSQWIFVITFLNLYTWACIPLWNNFVSILIKSKNNGKRLRRWICWSLVTLEHILSGIIFPCTYSLHSLIVALHLFCSFSNHYCSRKYFIVHFLMTIALESISLLFFWLLLQVDIAKWINCILQLEIIDFGTPSWLLNHFFLYELATISVFSRSMFKGSYLVVFQ